MPSSPLDFLKILAGQFRQAGIRFAITSGMACVHYGLQQTTKDSDWIIAPEDFGKLRELFESLEQGGSPWRVSYRNIFGAPLDIEFMAHGWTSHLLVTQPDGLENKVDFFGKAPRVRHVALDPESPDFADRDVVAQMDFYRSWQKEPGFAWPSRESFARQHQRVLLAARGHGLPRNPVDAVGREAILAKALDRAVVKAQTTREILNLIQPPLEEMLP